ncbi:MAG: hypothetical protein GY922_07030 [Proteobacteria bacterium]|nr:hypothetical protein [Pseudomonadota bacterium]
MGDIHGNLWALDFSSKLMSEWNVANAAPLCSGANRYNLGISMDDADEVGVKVIRSGDNQLEGRLSWQQVNPGQ